MVTSGDRDLLDARVRELLDATEALCNELEPFWKNRPVREIVNAVRDALAASRIQGSEAPLPPGPWEFCRDCGARMMWSDPDVSAPSWMCPRCVYYRMVRAEGAAPRAVEGASPRRGGHPQMTSRDLHAFRTHQLWREAYPEMDGDVSLNDARTICRWLAHRGLWHIVRNWLKVRWYA